MRQYHKGFTLVELLVVIAIIGTLVALLLPAVQAARETARGNTCRNNLKQLQLALQNMDTQQGRLPGYSNELINPTALKDDLGRPMGTGAGRRASWIVMLFPFMEQNALWDEWNRFDGPASAPPIENLTCPSDAPDVPGDPWLNYVANAGRAFGDPTRSGSGPFREIAANGIFFDDNRNPYIAQTDGAGDGNAQNVRDFPRIKMTMAYIQSNDGTSKTMMISESLHTWYWCYDIDVPTTGSTIPIQLDGSQIQDTKHLFGFVWSNDPQSIERINGDRYFDQADPPQGMSEFAGPDRPDRSNPGYESYGWPSSNHPGGINVAFAGGQVVFMNQTVDSLVYSQLMTSNRNRSELADYNQSPPIPDRRLQQPSDDAY